MTSQPSVRRAAAAAVALVLGIAVPATSAEAGIKMREGGTGSFYYFGPAYRVISAGDTVTWTNETGAEHTVTTFPGAPDPFDSSPQTEQVCDNSDLVDPTDCVGKAGSANSTYSFQFTTPGNYYYFCKPHRVGTAMPDPRAGADEQPCGMCGTIVVKAKATRPPPSPLRTTATATPRATATASPTHSASPTPTSTVSATPGGVQNGSPLAAPGTGGGGGGRATVAVIVILLLSAAGYATWRRFLAEPPR